MPDDDGDAKFLIKNFVMPSIDRIDRKLDQVCTANIELKITDEQIKAKVAHVELMNIRTQEMLTQHQDDMAKHYNPYYDESIPQKLWRKKPEIATGVSISTAIFAVILKLLEVI